MGSTRCSWRSRAPLSPGMYYQFRVVSMKGGVPISATEDLKGVFVYK
ncbi:MAG TPA: hypothetical protein PLI95_13495 [Polyangiaceae bacterium]|nr:hypothetical protein [Polyangiaceae bacterium]